MIMITCTLHNVKHWINYIPLESITDLFPDEDEETLTTLC
jgi:hypothetical protein